MSGLISFLLGVVVSVATAAVVASLVWFLRSGYFYVGALVGGYKRFASRAGWHGRIENDDGGHVDQLFRVTLQLRRYFWGVVTVGPPHQAVEYSLSGVFHAPDLLSYTYRARGSGSSSAPTDFGCGIVEFETDDSGRGSIVGYGPETDDFVEGVTQTVFRLQRIS